MKQSSFLVMVLLIFSSLSGYTTISAIDNTPPVLQNITLNTNNATIGETIVFTINATDPEGISLIELSLYSVGDGPSGGNRYLTWLNPTLNSTSGLYQGTYQVQLYDTNTSIFVSSVYLSDVNSASVVYYNDFYYSYTPSFNLADINIYGTEPDYTPPILISAGFSSNFATGNDTVEITLEAEDKQSGLANYSYGYIYRDNSGTGNYYDGDYITDVYLTKDGTKYTGEWRVNQYLTNGTYILGRVELYDNKNNYAYYENATTTSNPLDSPYITISNEYSDSQAPVIYDLYFEYANLSDPYDQILYTRIVEDLSGLDYGYFDLYYFNSTSNSSVFYGSISVRDYYYNATMDLFELPLQYIDTSISLPDGAEIYIGHYYLIDTVGNSIQVHNYSGDGGLPSFSISENLPSVLGPRMMIEITPQSPTVLVWQTVNFEANITNLMGTDISGNYTLDIYGLESGLGTEFMSFFEGQSAIVPIDIVFPSVGQYKLLLIFETDTGQIFSASVTIRVVDPAPNGEILISFDPTNPEIEVSVPVNFDVILNNNLGYDIFGYFELNVFGNSSWNVAYDNFTIQAGDTYIFSQEIVFSSAGSFSLEAQFMLENGTLYSEIIGLNVVSSTDTTDPVSSEPTLTTTVTSSTTASSNTSSYATSPIQLPGFEITVTLLGISLIIGMSTLRRRKTYITS